jgi:hypothetical protein
MDQGELKDIEQRQPKYWSMDGLPQLVTGVGWLLWGGVYLIGVSLLEGRAYLVYWAIATCLLGLWGFAVPRALGKLKEMVTYPRSGYARVTLQGRSSAQVALVCAAIVGFILLDLFFFKRKIDLHGFGPFLVGGLIALAIAAQSKRPWSKDAALWVYVLWLAILLQFRCKITNDAPVYWTLVCMGLIGIVFGALRLRRFLRENPKAAEA